MSGGARRYGCYGDVRARSPSDPCSDRRRGARACPSRPPRRRLTSESGNPINDQGSNYNYRSNITRVTPNVPGLSLQVLEFADRLLLTNHTGKTVTIYGYQGEPYARVLANGTAEQNTRSPATYLNTSFYGNVTVPASRQSERPAALGGGRPHGAVRMARPPHPLDVAADAAAGQGQEQAHADLRLAGADRGGRADGRDRRAAVLDARELQGARRA